MNGASCFEIPTGPPKSLSGSASVEMPSFVGHLRFYAIIQIVKSLFLHMWTFCGFFNFQTRDYCFHKNSARTVGASALKYLKGMGDFDVIFSLKVYLNNLMSHFFANFC